MTFPGRGDSALSDRNTWPPSYWVGPNKPLIAKGIIHVLRRNHSRAQRLARDIGNKLWFGTEAPIFKERIWINPKNVQWCIPQPTEIGLTLHHPDYESRNKAWRLSRTLIGRVVSNEVDFLPLVPIGELRKVRACLAHWKYGLSWEDAGAIDHLLFKIEHLKMPMSGCKSREDVKRRYQKLDTIFFNVQKSGALRSNSARNRWLVRENDGIEIHLGHNALPIFGDTGTHRLAMSLALGLNEVPASLGFVHRTALPWLQGLRHRRAQVDDRTVR